MSGTHETPTNLDNKLKLGIVLNTVFTVFEFTVGIASGSLALISDAGHNLTDSLTLVVSFCGNKISKREANEDHTYGYGRASILTALFNASILLVLSLFIFYEGYQRIMHPEPVKGNLVAIVAFIGILINGSIALLFRNNKDDLNIRSAYLNMAFDALASVGALLAGLIIIFTGKTIVDPFISIIIGIMLISSAWRVVRDAIHVLLEGVPEGIDAEKVKRAIKDVSYIKGVDDMHIWAISSQYAALSCHVVIEDCDLEKSTKIVKEIKDMLHQKFNIEHATIETELVACPPETLANLSATICSR
ncbi:cation diffusion facilitator family transporter [soil metagenome]